MATRRILAPCGASDMVRATTMTTPRRLRIYCRCVMTCSARRRGLWGGCRTGRPRRKQNVGIARRARRASSRAPRDSPRSEADPARAGRSAGSCRTARDRCDAVRWPPPIDEVPRRRRHCDSCRHLTCQTRAMLRATDRSLAATSEPETYVEEGQRVMRSALNGVPLSRRRSRRAPFRGESSRSHCQPRHVVDAQGDDVRGESQAWRGPAASRDEEIVIRAPNEASSSISLAQTDVPAI